jgi:hypothetical protein
MPQTCQGGVSFDRHAQPHMRGGAGPLIPLVDEVAHEATPFGEHLIDMPISGLHDPKDSIEKCPGDRVMEQVTHRVHEDAAWALPAERLGQAFRP